MSFNLAVKYSTHIFIKKIIEFDIFFGEKFGGK